MMVKVDKIEKMLKFFQYNWICLSDDNCYFVGIYSNICCKND